MWRSMSQMQELEKMSHFRTYLSLFLHSFVRFGLYIFIYTTTMPLKLK